MEDGFDRHDRACDCRRDVCLRTTGARVRAVRSGGQARKTGAFADARIAALHAGLKLNAEQEKNWPAVESALRDLAKQRQESMAARASAERPKDPIERSEPRCRRDAGAWRGA